MLQVGELSRLGLTLADWFRAPSEANPYLNRRHVSCIFLWLDGGPSRLEPFDPKPNTLDTVRGRLWRHQHQCARGWIRGLSTLLEELQQRGLLDSTPGRSAASAADSPPARSTGWSETARAARTTTAGTYCFKSHTMTRPSFVKVIAIVASGDICMFPNPVICRSSLHSGKE